MPPTSAPSARRGRRLLAAVLATVSFAAAAATLMTPVRAATPRSEPVAPGPVKRTTLPTETPSPSPTPSASPTCDFTADVNNCATPSPTPTEIVVSPVPASPSASPTTPSYLLGTEPSPSPRIGDTVATPASLGGGFVDQLPSPTAGIGTGPVGILAPHQSGLPLPFLVVGGLLILGALGSLIYALAPRDKAVFASAATRRASVSPVTFTPYGPDAPGTNILSPPRPKGPKGP